MAVSIRQPTANETPDSGQSGAAVTGISNTGHTETTTSSSATGTAPSGTATDSDAKSARWFTLVDVGGQRTSVKLQFTWIAQGAVDASGGMGGSDPQIDGTASCSCSFQIQYSVNGGSNWTTHVSDSASALSLGASPDSDTFENNNSADITLSDTQDISDVQVRVLYQTSADAEAGNGVENATAIADVSVTISDIQVEVTFVDGNVVVMM